ncbi:hypothetical protein EBU24_02000 [bacterium]|nr:hypothetical protein [bacterium]
MSFFKKPKTIIIFLSLVFLISLPIASEETDPGALTTSATSAQPEKTAVVFDLGNVLITTSKKAAFDAIGLWKIVKYCKSPERIPPILYDLLNKIRGQRINNVINDPYGNCLPDIFCEALTGKRDEHQCLSEVLTGIENNKHHFSSKTERKIAKVMAKFMFDPQTLCNLQLINRDALDLLRTCVNRGHEVFIFSNFSPQAFNLIKNKFPEIFNLVPAEHLIVSGTIGHAKPHPTAYQILVEKLTAAGVKVDPAHVFFIDDQKENVEPVKAHGITGLVYDENNHKQTHHELVAHRII